MADDERNVIDEEDVYAQQERAAPLPIDWKTGGQVIAREQLIRKPTARQAQVFASARVRTCADCKFFRHDALQKPKGLVRGFMHRLWEEWGTKGSNFLGDRPDRMGRCAQDEELVTGPSSLACDHYKPKR